MIINSRLFLAYEDGESVKKNNRLDINFENSKAHRKLTSFIFEVSNFKKTTQFLSEYSATHQWSAAQLCLAGTVIQLIQYVHSKIAVVVWSAGEELSSDPCTQTSGCTGNIRKFPTLLSSLLKSCVFGHVSSRCIHGQVATLCFWCLSTCWQTWCRFNINMITMEELMKRVIGWIWFCF